MSHVTAVHLRMNAKQRAFIALRTNPPYPGVGETCRKIGVKESTGYSWMTHPEMKAAIDEGIKASQAELIESVRSTMIAVLPHALAVKIGILGNEAAPLPLRDKVATDIIEQLVGKAMERRELSGPGGEALRIRQEHDLDFDALDDGELDTFIRLAHKANPARLPESPEAPST